MGILAFCCGFVCGVVFIATMAAGYLSGQVKSEEEKKRAARLERMAMLERKRIESFDVQL